MFEAYASKFFKSEPFNSEDCEDQAGVVDWRLRNKQSTDHVEHGRSAAKWELHSGEKVKNPHHPDSDEGREWQFGYNEEKGIKKEEAAEENEPFSKEDFDSVTPTDEHYLLDLQAYVDKIPFKSKELKLAILDALDGDIRAMASEDNEVTDGSDDGDDTIDTNGNEDGEGISGVL